MSTVTVTETTQTLQQPVQKCLIIIDDIEYDVSHWKYSHPGGQIILQQYHNKDATDAFYAFHHPDTFEKLKKLKQKPVEKPAALDPKIKAWREFRKKVIADGYLKRDYLWYLYKTTETLSLWALGIYFGVFTQYWILSAIFLGIFWQQAGWLGHEYAHHQVFLNRKLNNAFVYFLSNVGMGFCVLWWKERHNTHHAITNVLESDPDVQNLPLFCWDLKDIHRVPLWALAKRIVPYQHLYFLPFTPSLRVIWVLQSLAFSFGLRNHTNSSFKYNFKIEFPLISLHWIWYFTFLYFLQVPAWYFVPIHIVLSQGIGGACIALIVFTSHYSCQLYAQDDRTQVNFMDLQLYTTRNIQPGIFMDWFAGGLNYQIEHHLFPTAPRSNLSKLTPLVKQFCKENNMPYHVAPFSTCIYYILSRLKEVAGGWREANKQNKSK